jgi:Mg2+ and Co2+ transporter CorA
MSEFMVRPRKNQTYLEQVADTGDALAKFHRQLLGNSVRIHIPLRDVVDLRRVATILRVLASTLDVLSRDKKRDFSVLFQARQAIKLADAQIRSQKALGKFEEDH